MRRRTAHSTDDLDEVLQEELARIKTRREVCGLETDLEKEPLVGLALSGGGLRSACFSIGIVQSLFRSGIWKKIDYLSSVSGGGYLAGYITNHLVREKSPLDEVGFPLDSERTGNDVSEGKASKNDFEPSPMQSRNVRKLVHSGNYLLRPGFFMNRYLFGLVAINSATISLLIAFATLIAFLWRCLDYDFVRRNADLIDLNDDLLVPFFPALFLGVAWLISWCISVFRRNDISTGGIARVLMYLTIPSVLIALAIVLGDGDLQGKSIEGFFGVDAFALPGTIGASVAGIIGASILPWIRPKRILESGINPRKPWERYVFVITSFGLLAGVPLLVISWIGRENVSGYNTHEYRRVVGGDIIEPVWLSSLIVDAESSRGTGDQLTSPNRDAKSNESESAIFKNATSDKDGDGIDDNILYVKALCRRSLIKNFLSELDCGDDQIPKILVSSDACQEQDWHPIKIAHNFVTEEWNNRVSGRSLQEVNSISKLMFLPSTGKFDRDVESTFATDFSEHSFEFPEDEVWEYLRLIDSMSAKTERDLQLVQESRERTGQNSISLMLYSDDAYKARHIDIEETRVHIFNALIRSAAAIKLLAPLLQRNTAELKHHLRFDATPYLPDIRQDYSNIGYWFPSLGPTKSTSYVLAQRLVTKLRDQIGESFELALFDDRELRKELIDAISDDVEKQDSVHKGEFDSFRQKIQLMSRPNLTPEKGRRLSRLAFEELLPDIFRERSAIRRRTTHLHDQWTRCFILIVASFAAFATSTIINLNTVSLHRYYRNRIAHAFVSCTKNCEESRSLSALNTCDFGGPYHLISATVSLWRNRIFQMSALPDDFTEDSDEADVGKSLRSSDCFVFSQQYCGSELTGFARTTDYESRIPGALNKLDLADAIAISGAAVSPGHASNPLISAMMLCMNLRLGQWLPNPRYMPKSIPNIAGRIIDVFRDWRNRSYFFVSDGGVHENLGLKQLIKRKCRLIISVDAGCDSDYSFGDLAKSISDVRVHDGVRVIEIDESESNRRAFSLEQLRPLKKSDDGEDSDCFSEKHFKVARIIYGDGSLGTLLYIKPTLTGDESVDLFYYRTENSEFPHQSTSDQFYSPTQVEAYRRLGEHIGKKVARVFSKTLENESVEDICQVLEKYQNDANQKQ